MKKNDAYTKKVQNLTRKLISEASTFIGEESTEYEEFFKSSLEKFGVSSPDELADEKKDDFFDYIDKNWKGDDEPAEDDDVAEIRNIIRNEIRGALSEARPRAAANDPNSFLRPKPDFLRPSSEPYAEKDKAAFKKIFPKLEKALKALDDGFNEIEKNLSTFGAPGGAKAFDDAIFSGLATAKARGKTKFDLRAAILELKIYMS